MILYLIIITVCAFGIAGAVAFTYTANFWLIAGLTWIGVVLSIVIDGTVCGIVRGLPKKIAQHDKKIFTVSAKDHAYGKVPTTDLAAEIVGESKFIIYVAKIGK